MRNGRQPQTFESNLYVADAVQGHRPTVFYAKPSTGQATYANLATQCEKADIPSLLYLPSDAQLVADSYSLVVDAIFGVGYNPPMGSDLAAIVQTISRSKVPVVSIDVPSGEFFSHYRLQRHMAIYNGPYVVGSAIYHKK